jgi:hypothetical protein
MLLNRPITLAALAAAILAAPATTSASSFVIESAVGDAAAVTAARDAFRTGIGGGTTAGANGSFGGVRREINWDGVPDGFAAPNSLPANFFNVNSPRGVVFATPGTGFQVSANAASIFGVPQFGNLDPSYPSEFDAFSPEKLFTALGSNIVDVTFFVPGTTTAALTSAFGAIFTDVDFASTTSIEYFDAANVSLGLFYVPAIAGSETFSFLGVRLAAAEISRVRITSGNIALGAGVTDGGPRDVVAMDDFIYAEPGAVAPTAVPEPASLLLVGTGIVAAMRRRRNI